MSTYGRFPRKGSVMFEEGTMSNLSKGIRSAAVFLTSLCFLQSLAASQADPAKIFPIRPIRILVGSTAGGGTDTTARAIAQKLTEAWGHQVIVDNRPGATSAIALDLGANAAPDGYTLCMVTASETIASAVNPRLPYSLTKDFAAISQASSYFFVLYHNPAVPVASARDLIAYAKVHPGKLNYGTSGIGSTQHLAWELFSHMTGAKFVHVPYKGGIAAFNATLAGETQVGMVSLIPLRPHISSGRLRALAITALKRSSAAPELPTVAEAGVPGYVVDSWNGVVTGAKVSPAIVGKLSAGIAEALKSPDVAQRLALDGFTPAGSSPEEFGAYIKSEVAKWRNLIRDARLALN